MNYARLCTLQPLQCAQLTSSVVEMDAVFVCHGGVMTRTTALTTAMKRAVRKRVSLLFLAVSFLKKLNITQASNVVMTTAHSTSLLLISFLFSLVVETLAFEP